MSYSGMRHCDEATFICRNRAHAALTMSIPSDPIHRTRYGRAHPEFLENPLWEEAASNEWSGYQLRQQLHQDGSSGDRHDFSDSSYRDSVPGPYWSWQRFGRTSTALPDGRMIHIAGEHEDAYDPDFCIYNDVAVDYTGGRREFYLYPKDVFPPTDFHTATLVDRHIILIGSLGYKDLRRIGATQILKLDTRTLKFEALDAGGECPGWVSRHNAEKIGDDVIRVVGGKLQTDEGYVDNKEVFDLDLRVMRWRRRKHGDLAMFPISADDYGRFRSPVYGSANPERSENPFWLEMAKRNWRPSRARLHFGDPSPPRQSASRLSREVAAGGSRERTGDTVWTAVRSDAGRVDLPDGRRLLIGGRVLDYGDEAADGWVYNDIVVTDDSGTPAIYAYPQSIFPLLTAWIAQVHADSVFIFGFADRDYQSEHMERLIVLRLDSGSFAISPLPVAEPSGFRLKLYPGCGVRSGSCIVFPNLRTTEEEPMLGIAFDMDKLSWSSPFPA